MKGEPHPYIAGELLGWVARVLPPAEVERLVPFLQSNHLSVRLSAIEALIGIDPQKLVGELPRLLSSSDPLLKSLGIRALAKIDPNEMFFHLEAMFRDQDALMRRTAIWTCLHLDSGLYESLLLDFFSVETDLALIGKAGMLLLRKADPEIPYRLYEILEDSSPEKSALLKPLFQRSIELIEKSGVLGEDFADFRRKLDTWTSQRAARKLVQEYLPLLSASPEERDGVAETQLLVRLQDPKIRSTFNDALKWQIPEAAKERITEILASDVTPPPESRAVSLSDFKSLSPEERVRKFNSWPALEQTDAVPCIENQVHDETVPPVVRAAALRTALRFRITEFAETAVAFCNGTEPTLIRAGMEYLGELDPEKVFPLLGMFMKSSDPQVRTQALSLMSRHDSRQAVSSLMALLRSGEGITDRMAMQCLVRFDFHLLREPLADLMMRTPARRFLAPVLMLFQANPDPENLFTLFRMEKAFSGKEAEQVKGARERCRELLIRLGRVIPEELEQREKVFEKIVKREEARQAGTLPAYAIENVRSGKGEESFPERIEEAVIAIWREIRSQDPRTLAVAVFLLLLPVVYVFLLFSTGEESYSIDPATVANLRRGPQSTRVMSWNTIGAKAPVTSAGAPGTSFSAITGELQLAEKEIRQDAAKPFEIPGMTPQEKMVFDANQNMFLSEGVAASQRGEFNQAETLLMDALKSDPDNAFLRVLVFSSLCDLFFRQGKLKEYEQTFRAYVSSVGKLPFGLGEEYMKNVRGAFEMLKVLEENIGKPELAGLIPASAGGKPAPGRDALADGLRRHAGALPLPTD